MDGDMAVLVAPEGDTAARFEAGLSAFSLLSACS